MQLHKIKEIITNFEPLNDKPLELEVLAIYCESVLGFIVSVKLNGVNIVVSSKREDRRVFKSIDGLRKKLSESAINTFNVNG